jgi:hypothetical protein
LEVWRIGKREEWRVDELEGWEVAKGEEWQVGGLEGGKVKGRHWPG